MSAGTPFPIEALELSALIHEAIEISIAPLVKRIGALEQQTKGLPLPTLADVFRGTWKSDATYGRGDLVIHNGSTWLCRERNAGAKPGESREWVLFAKRAR
jgi:hypothetical protein